MIVEKDGLYYHAAFAEDDEGTGFSLTDFDGAVYVGNYVDKSATESTDWTSYSWQVRGEVSVTDLEDDTELMESVEESELQDAMEDAEEDRDELRADVIENDENLQATQHASDEGIGNLNELIGTNQGTNGWTASSGLTIDAVTGTIYNDTNDEVNYLKVTCNTAGSNYIYFDASKLREKLSQKLDTNAYTFSADVNMETPFSVDVSVADLDGSNTQIEFEPITNDAVIDSDGAWIFNSSTGDVIQANNEPIPVSAQVLLFDLSNMTSGNVLMIANLKVEGGGLATPWRASLEEVKGMATEALNKATEVNQHFWHDTSGAHVTEVTQDEYEQDPTNAGGNVLITSEGMHVLEGENEIAQFLYNGMAIKGMDGVIFFQAQDQRNQDGKIVQTITADGSSSYELTFLQVPNTMTATVDGVELVYGTDFGESQGMDIWGNDVGYIEFSTNPPASGSEIVVTYTPDEEAKYYTLGIRGQGRKGSLSVAENKNTTASGAYSHAEGEGTKATGVASHAEGQNTVAGDGKNAHAQNEGTIAYWAGQTAIGTYNKKDTDPATHPYLGGNYGAYALIIGNGSGDTRRSNALTIDWVGNLKAEGDLTDGSGNTLSSKLDASALADYVIEEGTQSNWEYRKWNSGKVEAWRTITNSAAAGSVWVSPLYYRDLTVSIPSGLFTSAPKIQCTSTNSQWWVSYANCTSATSLAYRIVKPVSTSQASGVNIYLEGE